jgi:hypothetical protein
MSTPSEAPRERGESALQRRASWPRNWMRAALELGSLTDERRARVLREIDEGSQPTAVYYVLPPS